MDDDSRQFAPLITMLREGTGYGKRAADLAENVREVSMRGIDDAVESARDCRDWAEEVETLLSKVPDGYDLEIRLVRKAA